MKYIFVALLFIITIITTDKAQAACTSPTGAQGEIIYNVDHQTFQGCTASGWKSVITSFNGSTTMLPNLPDAIVCGYSAIPNDRFILYPGQMIGSTTITYASPNKGDVYSISFAPDGTYVSSTGIASTGFTLAQIWM